MAGVVSRVLGNMTAPRAHDATPVVQTKAAGSMTNDKKKHAKKAKRHRYKKKRQAMKNRKTGR